MTDSLQLFKLLEEGDLKAFKKVAVRAPGIRVFRDKYGDFLLHRAASLGLLQVCEYLLTRGIPADCPGYRGATPLHYAAEKGDVSIMKLLVEAVGPNLSPINANGITPLHVAAGVGRLTIVKLLIDRGANPVPQDKFGRLPLHYAAGADQLAVVNWLVGVDCGLIDRPDAFGQRPIHWALQFECVRAATAIVGFGANLADPDIYGRPPLSFLRLSNETGSSRLLEDARVKQALKKAKIRKLTTLDRAIFQGQNTEVMQNLGKTVLLNRQGCLGRTVVHTAAFAKNMELFEWMREKGADMHIVDDYGWTPKKLLSYRLITRLSPMPGNTPPKKRLLHHEMFSPT
jgi:ankyrin repeat protein